MRLPKWCNRDLFFALFLLLVVAFSKERVSSLRMATIGLASLPAKMRAQSSNEELLRLQAINQQLSSEVDRLYSYLVRYQPSLQQEGSAPLAAKILYRDPAPWSTTLWVNQGARDGVQKNSIAIVGTFLLGLVDHVGEKRSRVRLLTDSSLVPSVRAQRGSAQHRLAASEVQTLLNTLPHLDTLFKNEAEKREIIEQLTRLETKLMLDQKSLDLAKGEMHGSGPPLFRKRSLFLCGEGFNYDHADEKGGVRQITSNILRLGDLLVTTGMDGRFPEGLTVGVVTDVTPLQEGEFSYNIEARMAVQNLADLKVLHLLPPI